MGGLKLLPAVVAVVLLAGCKDSDSGASGEVGSALPATPEQSYLDALDEAGVDYPSDGYALAMGRGVCDVRKGGGTSFDAADQIERVNGYGSFQAGVIAGAAVSALCPEVTR